MSRPLISDLMEYAWRVDAGTRLREQLKKPSLSEILERDEVNLPDYPRPLAPDNLKRHKGKHIPWYRYLLP